MTIPWISADELLSPQPADLGAESGRPLRVVDLDAPEWSSVDVDLLRLRAEQSSAPLIGVARGKADPELTRILDFTLSDAGGNTGGSETGERSLIDPTSFGGDIERDLERIIEFTSDRVQTAQIGRTVLRTTERLEVAQALAIESMAFSLLQSGEEFQEWLAGRDVAEPIQRGDEVLLEELGEGAVRIILNRPKERNAMNAALRLGLLDALEVARLRGVSGIELTAAGRHFSTGGDLVEFGAFSNPVSSHLLRLSWSIGMRLHELRERVTVRVQGACLGAGVEIAAFAGRVVSQPGAYFRLPELELGLIPGAGGMVSLPRRIGRWRAAYMLLSGRSIPSRTALEWGLVDEVVEG